jgi:UDP-N-acetylmuramyl pentapeptide synthase
MHILVLDTIHGGKAIGLAYAARGDCVDCVDVYRGESLTDVTTALTRKYDLIVAPVHLDPGHPLLNFSKAKVISHHESVRELLGRNTPEPMIEITGTQGKTTTAYALAFLMRGRGILHTSTGTYQYPEKKLLSQSSITPASVLAVAKMACKIHGWLIVEESLGITCSGTLGIITSDEDYFFAAGKKSALNTKLTSAQNCKQLLLGKNIPSNHHKHVVHVEDIAACKGSECSLTIAGKTCRFSNPLLELSAYQSPLVLAAAAAMLLGIDPDPLSSFSALQGRLSVSYNHGVLIVDNANSGTNLATTVEAARYARSISGKEAITLVIGQSEDDGAVCEGFALDQIREAIDRIRPLCVIGVGAFLMPGTHEFEGLTPLISAYTTTFAEACTLALRMTDNGSIVLAVKTWR